MKEDSLNNMQLNSANMFFTAVFQEWLMNPDKSFRKVILCATL